MATIKGIDCRTPITPKVANELYSAGIRFVCRYLVPENYPKHLSLEEAQLLSDTGFLVVCVFETTADRARGGAKNGAYDGKIAYAAAKRLRIPKNGTLFFAVDFDARDNDMDTVEAYLRAARQQTEDYKIGVYGSYRVMESMAARGACDGFWQTYAWSSKNKSTHATIYQYLNNQNLAGINVDYNEAYSDQGMWDYRNESEGGLNMTIEEAREALTTLAKTQDTHSDWADEAVKKLTDAGIFNGDGQGNYGWEQCMTREAVAVVLHNMLGKLGLLDNL